MYLTTAVAYVAVTYLNKKYTGHKTNPKGRSNMHYVRWLGLFTSIAVMFFSKINTYKESTKYAVRTLVLAFFTSTCSDFFLFVRVFRRKQTHTHTSPVSHPCQDFCGSHHVPGVGAHDTKKMIVRWLLIGETQSNPRAGLSIKHVVSLVLIANFSQSRGGF